MNTFPASDVEPISPQAPKIPPPVLMQQSWVDLASVHWAVDPESVAPNLPPGIRPDVLHGRTYVGLVPFRMVDAGLSTAPPVPRFGAFLETNVRVYSVDATGRRGVVFCSLDTDRLAVVAGTHAIFGLPYRWSAMSYEQRWEAAGTVHEYRSRVRGPADDRPGSRLVVRDLGPLGEDDAGVDVELAQFLSARWGLHLHRWGRTWYVPTEHPSWPLHRAELVHIEDGLVGAAGWPEVSRRAPDLVLYSPGVRARFGRPCLASTPRARSTHPTA